MYGGAAAALPDAVPTDRLIAQRGLFDTAAIVRLVEAATGGVTKVFIDELGYGGDPPINYTMTLEGGALRGPYQNPRAAWFAAAWARLAAVGVEAMGFSQFYGFPFGDGAGSPTFAPGSNSNPFLFNCSEGSVSQGPYCGFPALSSLDYDTAVPNARYHTVKLLIDEMGSDSVKAFSPVAVSAAGSTPHRAHCKALTTEHALDFAGGDLCEFDMTSVPSFSTCEHACCGNAHCDHFVMLENSSAWQSKGGTCAGGRPCFDGGVCCYLKTKHTRPYQPNDRTTRNYTRGTTSSSPVAPSLAALVSVGVRFEDNARKLLLVNMRNETLSVQLGGDGDDTLVGATHVWIDEAHGHGDVPCGVEQVSEPHVLMQAYGISVLELARKLTPRVEGNAMRPSALV
jgi:hypothetical protein